MAFELCMKYIAMNLVYQDMKFMHNIISFVNAHNLYAVIYTV